jgi:tRNA dimethylallyltransferase
MAIRGKNFFSSLNLDNKLVVILGPTAAGKSQLAVELAHKFQGEIVSADSRQIYRGLDIGTGKITKEEMEGIPHYLLSFVSPEKQFNVVQYQKEASKIIKNILRRDHLPFLVGGSPFYLETIVKGWQFPNVKANPSFRQELETKSLEELLEILNDLDPRYFEKIEKNNKRRIIRAIEIASQLGEVPPRKSNPLFSSLLLGLAVPFPQLKKQIAQRQEKLFNQGMIKEVENLHQQGLSWKRLEEFGLEYQWVSYYLQGKVEEKEMKEKLQRAVEKFAKRQMTWFKKNDQIHWIEKRQKAEELIESFLKKP